MPLGSIKLPNLGPMKLGSTSTVNLTTTGDFRFEFGFNFSAGNAFLLDTSRFNATASLASPVNAYSATIGGVSVTLGNPARPSINAYGLVAVVHRLR